MNAKVFHCKESRLWLVYTITYPSSNHTIARSRLLTHSLLKYPAIAAACIPSEFRAIDSTSSSSGVAIFFRSSFSFLFLSSICKHNTRYTPSLLLSYSHCSNLSPTMVSSNGVNGTHIEPIKGERPDFGTTRLDPSSKYTRWMDAISGCDRQEVPPNTCWLVLVHTHSQEDCLHRCWL